MDAPGASKRIASDALKAIACATECAGNADVLVALECANDGAHAYAYLYTCYIYRTSSSACAKFTLGQENTRLCVYLVQG